MGTDNGNRRARQLCGRWVAAGLVLSAATLTATAEPGGAATTAPPAPSVPPALPTPPTPPTPPRPVKIQVDPPAFGVVSHPLDLAVLGYDVTGTPLVTTTSPSGYRPATIKAYLKLTGTGSSQTIAIVDAYNDPTIASDLATFDKQFSLSAPPSFKKVSQTGSTSSLPTSDSGWSLETSLDVEWAHAIAPSASILLVEATTSSLSDLDTAIDYAAKQSGVTVISNSWGIAGELSSEMTLDSHCKLTTAVCVFSSGDSGNPGGYPAYSPYVVAVGGTTLSLTTSSTGAVSVASELAWSGSGGGISSYETKPAFQSNVSASGRTIPDVSYDADPATGFAVYDSTPYSGYSGWFQMGGTSAGAPQWAAIIAASDQLRKAKGKTALTGWTSTSVNRAATDIYGLTSGIALITSGASNGSCALCSPSLAYDAVTGLGSPRSGIDAALAAAS